MKITIVNGSMPHYDHGLSRVVSTVASTLVELGIEIDEINLGFVQLPYFDGMRAKAMDEMVARLRSSNGVIFACTTQLFAPSTMLKTFLEFLECDDYKNTLLEKHCMIVTVSKLGGERSTLEYLARIICCLGGYESGRIGLQESLARSIKDEPGSVKSGSIRDIIEKTAEDFYRAVRQNRKYIVPTDETPIAAPYHVSSQSPPPAHYLAPTQEPAPAPYLATAQGPASAPAPYSASPAQDSVSAPYLTSAQDSAPAPYLTSAQGPAPAPHPAPVQEPAPMQAIPGPASPAAHDNMAGKLNLEAFTERQEQDIKELTALFSQKYVPPDETQYTGPKPNLTQYQLPPGQQPVQRQIPPAAYKQATPPAPKVKNVKQLTQNLPHYYQPQMAAGLTALIQFSITGAEVFDGYLTIVDNECDYTDGLAENPEITIIADTATWRDVLSGKHTAQKAFMIGGLKVRGNFVLLTKFDTLFKLG